ncbi:MAG: protein kinase [Candidatus Aminicenantaceae bacterium]
MKCSRCSFDNPTDTNYCGRCGMSLTMDQQETFAYDKDTLRYIMEGINRGSIITDRYEVIEELGAGGMGTVYKVFDRKVNEKVALKLIRPEIAFDAHTIERFSNELRLARKVTHRNICRLYDLGEHGKLHFITMEYVAGQDFKRMIRMSRELSMGTAVAIGRQICEGLVESHRLGVVHRDLKPQNIMIDSDGNVKIMDFGIARSLYSKGVTMTGVLVGTPEYMSPEQAEASDVDHRADIYALGVILYEMVTGRVPFKGETPLSVAIKHREESPVDPCELNTQVSEDLCHVILRCLEKNKANRYQGAADLLEDLSRIEQGIPTIERVIPRSEKKTDTSKEVTVSFKPRRLIVVGFLLIVILASVGVVMKVSRDMRRASDLTGNLIVSEESRPTIPSKGERREVLREQIEGMDKSGAISTPELKVVPQPPPGIEVTTPEGFDMSKIVKFSDQYFGEGTNEFLKARGILQVLSYGSAHILQLLSEKDVEKFILAVDKALESMDADDPFAEEWSGIADHIRNWNEFRKIGDNERASFHYGSALNKINRLVPRIQVKDFADRSRREVGRTLQVSVTDLQESDESLLLGLAKSSREDADRAYQAKDFARAGILYSLAGEVFTLNEGCDGDAECLLSLRALVLKRREKADKAGAGKSISLYTEAQGAESRADRHLNSRNYSEAADFFLKAAVLYEQSIL